MRLATVPIDASRRSSLIALGWVAALVALVIAGVGGGSTPGTSSSTAAPAASLPRATRVTGTGTAALGAAPVDPVTFSVATTGRRLDVTGALFIDADLVAVTVETLDGRTQGWMLLGIRPPAASFGTTPAPAFLAQFDLPASVQAASLWIQVDAYNAAGADLAMVRRPVLADLLPMLRIGPRAL